MIHWGKHLNMIPYIISDWLHMSSIMCSKILSKLNKRKRKLRIILRSNQQTDLFHILSRIICQDLKSFHRDRCCRLNHYHKSCSYSYNSSIFLLINIIHLCILSCRLMKLIRSLLNIRSMKRRWCMMCILKNI